ncbi:uncharacterized protein METZ01_LOCUS341043 [marine metagenome]|uniref:Uncharacterized protein n=1 Tax=marine metagenome TaxID=408172 RepID=A0A382QRR0_9ZZZZ
MLFFRFDISVNIAFIGIGLGCGSFTDIHN